MIGVVTVVSFGMLLLIGILGGLRSIPMLTVLDRKNSPLLLYNA